MTNVYFGDCQVGWLSGQFRYKQEWLDWEGAFPVSASIPLRNGKIKDIQGKSMNWFMGLIPENIEYKVLALAFHATSYADRALEVIGKDTAGAFSFFRKQTHPELGQKPRIATKANIGEHLRRIRDKIWGPDYFSACLSGSFPKTTYSLGANGRWYIPAWNVPSTHIFKPAIKRTRNLDYVEHVVSLTARRVGLDAVETSLEQFGGTRTFVAKRYDRVRGADGTVARLHQEDLLQALGKARFLKYDIAIPELMQTIRRLDPGSEVEAWLRLAFFVAIGNTDAHAKNWAFLIDKDGHHLAPAYDLISMAAYPEYGPNLSMPVGEQSDFQKVEMSDWRAVSEVTDADWSMVKQAVEKVNDTIGAAFDAARLEVGADNKQLELITKHLKSKRRG